MIFLTLFLTFFKIGITTFGGGYAMVSSVGEAAVSGVSLVDMVNVLLINLFAALATGGAVVASQFIGSRDRKSACDSARQLMILSLVASLLIMTLALLLRGPILRLLFGTIADDVMDSAMTYFFWSALSYPFLALYNSGAALFRSMGNSKIPMYSSLVMNILNIGGNALLLYVAHMGVAGVAIASLFSRGVAMVIVFVLLSNPQNAVFVNFRKRFRVEWGMRRLKNLLRRHSLSPESACCWRRITRSTAPIEPNLLFSTLFRLMRSFARIGTGMRCSGLRTGACMKTSKRGSCSKALEGKRFLVGIEKPVVLIVEDQKINRQILRNMLCLEYEVLEAENGADGLEILERRQKISAILLDVVMPVMDGYTFLTKLKGTAFSKIPVIVMTGDKDENAEQMTLDLGACVPALLWRRSAHITLAPPS